MGVPAVDRSPGSRHALRWPAVGALAVGVALGVVQPLFVVVVGPGIYGGPSYLGLLFLACLAGTLLFGLISLVSRHGRDVTLPAVALCAALAVGLLGGNWTAATFHIGFATPPPPPVAHPTGPGWGATGDMLAGRADHSSTLLVDGRVLVAGGMGETEQELTSAELYDPQTGTWTATGSMATARSEHVAIRLADGRVLVLDRYGKTEIYDPRTGRWEQPGAMPVPFSAFAATLLTDGRVLACGNTTSASGATEPAAVLYNPTTGKWTATGPMLEPRVGQTATALGDGRVLVVGGRSDGAESSTNPMGFLGTSELYDPTTERWTSGEALTRPRSGHVAVLLEDGRVLVAAGSAAIIGLVELFDPTTGTWSLGGATQSWMTPVATRLANGRVLIVDGGGSLEVYDTTTGMTRRPGASGQGFGSATTLLADGRVLFTGGRILHYPGAADVLATAQLLRP